MIKIIPMTELQLERFLLEHDVTLTVRQRGDGGWEADTKPQLLYSQDYGAGDTFNTGDVVHGAGATSRAAIEHLCNVMTSRKVMIVRCKEVFDFRFVRVTPPKPPSEDDQQTLT